MIDFSQFDSFIVMTMYFNNEAMCRDAIVETRWDIGEGSTVFTDELNVYNQVGKMGYNHCICNHGALQSVCEDDGSVYTNNIEGFWNHFRRMITGRYHDVSDEHIQSYIDEACFRWNT